MASIECEVAEVNLENDRGDVVPGVRITCKRCQYSTESFGRTERSIRRCFVMLKEGCPEGESNYYKEEGS